MLGIPITLLLLCLFVKVSWGSIFIPLIPILFYGIFCSIVYKEKIDYKWIHIVFAIPLTICIMFTSIIILGIYFISKDGLIGTQ
jgi:hypothetical protein